MSLPPIRATGGKCSEVVEEISAVVLVSTCVAQQLKSKQGAVLATASRWSRTTRTQPYLFVHSHILTLNCRHHHTTHYLLKHLTYPPANENQRHGTKGSRNWVSHDMATTHLLL